MNKNIALPFQLGAVNQTIANYSCEETVIQIFEKTVKQYPKQVAIIHDDAQCAFGTLNQLANQYARYLIEKNIQPGTVVGVMLNRTLDLLVALLAIFKIGGIYFPIDPAWPFTWKMHLIKNSQTHAVIANLTEQSDQQIELVKLLDINANVSNKETDNLSNLSQPGQPAYVIYTSGSTGEPKGVIISHRALINRLEWMQNAFPIGLGDVVFQKTHFTFDVSVWELLWWSLTGASVLLLPLNKESDVQLISKLIMRHKVSVIHFVPSVYKLFLSYIEIACKPNNLSSLKYIFSSGEVLDRNSVNRTYRFFGAEGATKLVNLYGPTEATIDVSYHVCDPKQVDQAVPIGRPIQNTQLYVINDEEQLADLGMEGELYIGGVGLSMGYLNQHQLTKKSFVYAKWLKGERVYKTGDRARWAIDGNLYYLGRGDRQIKLRGQRIDLDELQFHVESHPKILCAHVLLKKLGENASALIAYYTVTDNQTTPGSDDLKSFLLKKIPAYMIPNKYIKLASFPLLQNGKLDQKGLMSLDEE